MKDQCSNLRWNPEKTGADATTQCMSVLHPNKSQIDLRFVKGGGE